MKKIIFTILLIAFGSFNTFAQAEITQEEYDVYAGVFEKRYENFKLDKAVTNLAILKDTVEPNFLGLEELLKDKRLTDNLFSVSSPDKIAQSDFEESVKDLKEKSSTSAKLEARFPIEYKYSLITKSEIEMLLEEGKKENAEYYKKCKPCGVNLFTWRPFFKKYINSLGYYSFSRVGFSKDKKLAVVYYTTYRGDKFSWTFCILSKTANSWKVSKQSGGGWVK